MSILKIFLIVLAAVIATIAALALVGIAANLLSYLFWLIVICIVLAVLVKLLGPKGAAPESNNEPQNRLRSAEQTIRSNCHRMIHRTNPMESIEQFRGRLEL